MTYLLGRRRRTTPAHEKSMDSYEIFAWRDAMAVADTLEADFGAARARKVYASLPGKTVIDFEDEHQQFIGDYIQKPENQRPALLKRYTKNQPDNTRIVLLVLIIIGVLRAKATMEKRDRFCTALAPGRGNRVTTATLYDFAQSMLQVYDYSWPSEVFEALGIDDCDEK